MRRDQIPLKNPTRVLYSHQFNPIYDPTMKYLVVHTSLLMCLFLVSCASQRVRAQDSKPEFKVSVKNSDDKIAILDEDSQTVIDIHSDFGIGSASFELVSGSMPDALLLRLHLKGLEDFQLISSQTTIAASISSGQVFNINSQRVIESNAGYPILSIHPLWLNIEIVSENREIPLEEGYFEITLPREFIRKAGSSFEVQWIDFYR